MTEKSDAWFMEDGEAPPSCHDRNHIIEEHFRDKVIGLSFDSEYVRDVQYPPYSPDLKPCDYFLWVYLKDKCYTPWNLDEWEQAMQGVIENIPHATFLVVIRSFKRRIQMIVEKRGGHI